MADGGIKTSIRISGSNNARMRNPFKIMIPNVEIIDVLREPPVYRTDENLIQVCAHCWPRNLIFLEFPALRGIGVKTKHGMCLVCINRELAQ
jgi:hypothetical protein